MLSGTVDIVSVHPSLDKVSVIANRGDGNFGAVSVAETSVAAFQTELKDLDNDGDLDAIVAHPGGTTLSMFLGNGNATFTGPIPVVTGVSVGSFALGDMNDDDILDLIVAPDVPGDLNLLFGEGDGTFNFDDAENIDFDLLIVDIVIGDIDRDKDLDILTANRDANSITAFYNDGQAGFEDNASFLAGEGPTSIAIGKLDNDAALDVAVTNPTTGVVTVLLNVGDGGFFVDDVVETNNMPDSIAIGNLDGDKDDDIVVGDFGVTNRTAVLINVLNEKKTKENSDDFIFFELASNPPVTNGSPGSVVFADADGDDDLDFYTANRLLDPTDVDNVSVFVNNGNGTFQVARNAGRGLQSQSVDAGDLDRDGTPDVVSIGASVAAAILGDGRGDFVEPQDTDVGSTPVAAAFGNFDNDGTEDEDDPDQNLLGTIDIVVLNQDDGTISILLNEGDGEFDIDDDDGVVPVGNMPRQIATGLIDDDGEEDLVITNAGDQSITILLGSKDGRFGGRRDFVVGTDVDGVAIGDVNGDTLADVVVGNRDSMFVSILFGNGDGSFAPPVARNVGTAPVDVVLADMNRDTRLDIVTSNELSNDVSVLLNNGGSSFLAAINTPVNASVSAVTVFDFNSDGDADLITANTDDDQIELYEGNGDGTFGASQVFDVGRGPVGLALGDVEDDGFMDVAVLNGQGESVTTLVGDGAGNLTLLQTLQTEPGPVSVYVADADPNLDFGTFDRDDSLVFRDGDGTKVKVKLSRNGEGRVTQDSYGRTMIRLVDTGRSAKLTITDGGGGNKVANIHDIIVVDGSMKAIKGKSTDVSGALTVSDGTIRKIEFRDVDTRSTWLIGEDDPRDALRLKFNSVKDTSINSKIPIKKIRVKEWLDLNSLQEPDVIAAPWVKSVNASRDFGAGFDLTGVGAPNGDALKSVKAGGDLPSGVYKVASGDIGSIKGGEVFEDFVIDAPNSDLRKFKSSGDATFDVELLSAGKVNVKGTLWESTLTLNQPVDSRQDALKKLKVKGKIDKLVLISGGNVGTINAQIMEEVFVYIAVRDLGPGETFPPASPNPFTASAELKKVKTKKLKDQEASFIKSVIAAARIKSAKLQYTEFDNNNIAFGVLADSIKLLTFREADVKNSHFKVKNEETQDDVEVDTDDLNDFEIRVV